ncbi:RNA polymerase sigma factor [Galbibacter pacificus]|uniref:RNA polymerase sigma-70 factor n=1 Tax=Galbibacter pacificus TaxID=2996052 RepID=A0ABT6FN27_9FLAO|nr:RNA polymerase sigma-70 factor [Galbibacter pacificus]MDG3581185.1 RNA polymerase sigma-70 factor [Galbibacter pacificus]MDG3584663.1 RNA polymerase sigma-70 factor [Galbibacter pacificus]
MKDTDDHFLFIKLKQDDIAAFEAIFSHYRLPILKFIVSYAKSVEVAEELTQETFIRLWESRATLNAQKSCRSFLYTIAKNLSLNYLRSNTKEEILKQELWDRVKMAQANPEERIVFEEYQTIFNQILEELPQKKRTIYIMSKYEGRSNEEIATTLGVTKKTVKNNLWETLRIIKDRLEPYLEYTIRIVLISFFSTFF